MRQAVEAQGSNPHFELGEQGLRQVLADVIQEVRRSVSQDIDGAEILHGLLNAPWLQSLLKVYECLQKRLRDSPEPYLDYASGLSLQLLIDIKSLPCCSEEAKELYRLLRQPHLQALLSAHDTVAQKDYEPVLPPMPEELPEDEEATRIVCLVKNKQPLLCDRRVSSPKCWSSSRGGIHPARRLPSVEPIRGEGLKASCGIWRGSQPQLPCRRPGHKPDFRCRVCCTGLFWEERLNRSAPSVYRSVLIDDIAKGFDGAGSSTNVPYPASQRWNASPPCSGLPHHPNVEEYLHPGLPRRLQSPRVHTAPPSPMHPHRLLDDSSIELAKQESLDELRSTVQLAASCMESSTKDIKLLGEKMTAATERITETVQDNSQALVLLTQVVDRLQTLLVASRSNFSPVNPTDSEQHSALTHLSRCSCTSSLSSSNSIDAPSTSQVAEHLSGSYQGSPRPVLTRTRHTPQQQKKHNGHQGSRRLTNGVLEERTPMGGGRTNKRRKKRRKSAT